MNYKEKRNSTLILIILSGIINVISLIPSSKADPTIIESKYLGNFYPYTNHSLFMTNANVLMDIESSKKQHYLDLIFDGNFTIFNPNKSINATIGFPFSNSFTGLEDSLLIKSNDTVIPYEIILLSDMDYLFWKDYFYDYYNYNYSYQFTADYEGLNKWLVICNISLPENDSIEMQYSFNARIFRSSYTDIFIYYDVGTSRTWNETITEIVEFKVIGQKPDDFGTHSNNGEIERKCTVVDNIDETSYIWEWDNETIQVDEVFIFFYNIGKNPYSPNENPELDFILIVTIISLAVIGIAVIILFKNITSGK